jgi:nitrite reductase (NADH) small subunit
MNRKRRWVRITDCRNIPVREGRSVKVAGCEVAIFNLGDRFLAIENRCPHKGGPLADGIVSGASVVCPLHAARVSLESGAIAGSAGAGACVKKFDVRVEDGCILLAIPNSARTEEATKTPHRELDCPASWMPATMRDPKESRIQSTDT